MFAAAVTFGSVPSLAGCGASPAAPSVAYGGDTTSGSNTTTVDAGPLVDFHPSVAVRPSVAVQMTVAVQMSVAMIQPGVAAYETVAVRPPPPSVAARPYDLYGVAARPLGVAARAPGVAARPVGPRKG